MGTYIGLTTAGEHEPGACRANPTGKPRCDIARFRNAHDEARIRVFEAGLGFNCDHRGSFDRASFEVARAHNPGRFDAALT